MVPRDEASDTKQMEVVNVVAVEPMAEAPVAELAEAVEGYIVAQAPAGEGEALSEPESPEQRAEGPKDAEGMSFDVVGEEQLQPLDEVPLHKNGQLGSVIECMLFVSSEPLSVAQLAESLELEQASVEEAMLGLEQKLNGGSGLQLVRLAGAYQLCTRPEYSQYCTMILQPAKRKLSKAALETLAVIAYRQPCTMPEIEAVRGVSVDGVMKTLMERGLVKEAGRKQAPGRPILYATTTEFLEYFGLNDITELPDIDMLAVEEVKALEAQKELFASQPQSGETEPVEASAEE